MEKADGQNQPSAWNEAGHFIQFGLDTLATNHFDRLSAAVQPYSTTSL